MARCKLRDMTGKSRHDNDITKTVPIKMIRRNAQGNHDKNEEDSATHTMRNCMAVNIPISVVL